MVTWIRLCGAFHRRGRSMDMAALAKAEYGLGSGGEIGDQLYDQLGAGKLDSINFQSVPADEAQDAGYRFWGLDAARATPEQTQAE